MNNNLGLYKLNSLPSYKSNIFEKIYISLLIFFILFSFFINIPTDTTGVGVSSSILDIGDRVFYINETAKGYGYEDTRRFGDFSGNILYPLVLKLITSFVSLFGEDQYSRIWNLIIISITSCFSIISLRLIRLSSSFIFGEKVSKIACIVFICNPYSFYYSLSGGITNFLILGVSFILYLFCKCYKNGYSLTRNIYLYDIFLITLGCSYLSFLRPNAAIFSLIILLVLLWKHIKKSFLLNEFSLLEVLKFLLILFGIGLVFFNLNLTFGYTASSVSLFANEGGSFFGFPREKLRDKLSLLSEKNILHNARLLIYFILWKITDFVSGLSDIRDSHSGLYAESLFPFIMRTFTGIFYLYPVNLFSFLGLIINIKLIFKTDLWIIILASLIAVSPSLLGVSMSRYLMMFYAPFILFSAKMIHDTLQGATKIKIK